MNERPSSKKKAPSPGVFRADEIYTMREFQIRAAMGPWAVREARKAGLKVVKIGNRRFVRGCDFAEFMNRQAELTEPVE